MPNCPEFVADELKKLVGKGKNLERFAFPPRLRKLAGVDGEPLLVAAAIVRRYLVEQIASQPGNPFNGRQYEAPLLRKVGVRLLDLDMTGHCAEIRRYDAITDLECFCSLGKWRKVMEYKLMLILAYHLTRTPNVQ